MIMQDKLEKERNDAKNAVEECVYEFRDKLCGPYEKFICEQVGPGCLTLTRLCLWSLECSKNKSWRAELSRPWTGAQLP